MASPVDHIKNILFTPLPIPGAGHITGANKLHELKSQAKSRLDNQRIQEALAQIEMDYTLMRHADTRHEQDQQIEAMLFPPAQSAARNALSPGLQELKDEFDLLENYKAKMRNSLRPRHEQEIEQVMQAIGQSDNTVSKVLGRQFATLGKTRLEVMAERTGILAQRERCYGLVRQHLQEYGLGSRKTFPPLAPKSIDPMLGYIHNRDTIQDLLAQHHDTSSQIQEEIIRKEQEIATLQKSGDTLKTDIDQQLAAQQKKITRRAVLGVGTTLALTAVGLGGREIAALNRRHLDYADTVEPFQKLDFAGEKQSLGIYSHAFRNQLVDRAYLPVQAHCVEQDVRAEHGKATALFMDVAHRCASGNPNAHTDLARVTLHGGTNNSIAVPFLEQSYLVERRLHAAENMLADTQDHHVFNTSITKDIAIRPGSNHAKQELDFMLSITCPVTVPTGNEQGARDIVTGNSQHIGALSHYPRYALQVGQADYQPPVRGWDAYVNISHHNHPYPFAVFAMPQSNDPYLETLSPDGEVTGSSMCCAGYGGYLAAIKSRFPELNWDNILYALALGGEQKAPGAWLDNPQNDTRMHQKGGFGLPDSTHVELILHNMLAQKVAHPEIAHTPAYIVRDVLRSKTAKQHEIILPRNQDVLKYTLDIMPQDPDVPTAVTVSDAHHHQKTFQLVQGQGLSRFTDWGLIGQSGQALKVTANTPVRVGYVAHTNAHEAISLGIHRLKDLKPIGQLDRNVDKAALSALAVAMPVEAHALSRQQHSTRR